MKANLLVRTRDLRIQHDRGLAGDECFDDVVRGYAAGKLTQQQLVLLARYAEGLAAYRARRWDDARAAFQAALEAVPGDGPSKAMAERAGNFRANPPPADWDGAWRLDQK